MTHPHNHGDCVRMSWYEAVRISSSGLSPVSLKTSENEWINCTGTLAYNDKYIEFYDDESEDNSEIIKLYLNKKDALEKAAQLEQNLHHQSGASGASGASN